MVPWFNAICNILIFLFFIFVKIRSGAQVFFLEVAKQQPSTICHTDLSLLTVCVLSSGFSV